MRNSYSLEALSYLSVLVAMVLLPLKTTISNFGIIILIVVSVFSLIVNGGYWYKLKKKEFYLSTSLAFFIPILIGYVYATNFEKGLSEAIKNVFYLLVPIVILRKDLKYKELLFWSSKGLIYGSVVSMVLLLSINLYNFYISELPISKLLSYNYTSLSFVSPLKDMHPFYLGTYYLFMLILLWQPIIKIKKGFKVAITTLTIICLVFINSRNIFFIGMLLLTISLFKSVKPLKSLVILGSIIGVFLLVKPVLKDTYLYNKLSKGTLWELTDNVATNNTDSKKLSDSRMARWKVALELIRERPILGYGTSSEKQILEKRYTEKGMRISANQRFDAHNQYLSYSLQYGFVGLFFIFIFFISNLRRSLFKKHFLLFTFVLILSCACLTENYLTRNMGINFVALFITILYFKPNLR